MQPAGEKPFQEVQNCAGQAIPVERLTVCYSTHPNLKSQLSYRKISRRSLQVSSFLTDDQTLRDDENPNAVSNLDTATALVNVVSEACSVEDDLWGLEKLVVYCENEQEFQALEEAVKATASRKIAQ